METDRERCVTLRGSFVLGRQELSSLLWDSRTALNSQRGLDASALRDVKSWGSLTVPVHRAVLLPISEASHKREMGAKNREWERLRVFNLIPGNSGLFRFLTNRQKCLRLS
jgi:hypothetical protein